MDNNIDVSKNCRVWLFWKPRIKLTVLQRTCQFMHCLIKIEKHMKGYVTLVYAANSANQRKELWGELRVMGNQVNEKWCLL